VCVCVCVHPFVLSAKLDSAIFCMSAMSTYCRMRHKQPPLYSASMKQSLREMRADPSTAELVLCGARCSATLECFGSKGQCRNKCINNCFECFGCACGAHTCSIHSTFCWAPQHILDEMVGTTAHFVAVDPQQYYQVGP
jgi:hypothetical protein